MEQLAKINESLDSKPAACVSLFASFFKHRTRDDFNKLSY